MKNGTGHPEKRGYLPKIISWVDKENRRLYVSDKFLREETLELQSKSDCTSDNTVEQQKRKTSCQIHATTLKSYYITLIPTLAGSILATQSLFKLFAIP